MDLNHRRANKRTEDQLLKLAPIEEVLAEENELEAWDADGIGYENPDEDVLDY